MRVVVGVSDADVAVKAGRGVRVVVEIGDGFEVAIGAVVGALAVGGFGEVAHAAKSNKPAQMPKMMGNRVLFMPSVYNGFRLRFSTLARRLSGDCSPICHSERTK